MAIEAEGAASLTPGQAARAFVRPEDVRIGPDAEGHPGAFEALVTGVEFLGPVCRVHLLAEGVKLEADVASEHIPRLDLARAVRLRVAIPADRVMTYPDV
jgi:iron(III) transport system ATP-binding protein